MNLSNVYYLYSIIQVIVNSRFRSQKNVFILVKYLFSSELNRRRSYTPTHPFVPDNRFNPYVIKMLSSVRCFNINILLNLTESTNGARRPKHRINNTSRNTRCLTMKQIKTVYGFHTERRSDKPRKNAEPDFHNNMASGDKTCAQKSFS